MLGAVNTPDAVARLNSALQGRYRIEREIGEGGIATVYLAKDLKHERRVALKITKMFIVPWTMPWAWFSKELLGQVATRRCWTWWPG